MSFKPSKEMIKAASLLMAAMAFEQTIKPVVESYQLKILLECKFPYYCPDDCPPKTKERLEYYFKDKPFVSELNKVYLLSEENFQKFHALCKIEEAKAGLSTEKPEFCPLLVAQSNVRKAEHLFIDVMEPFTKINSDMILNLDHRRKLIDLSLRFLAPFLGQDHKTVLKNINIS